MRKVLVAVIGACLLALCLGAQVARAEDVTVCPPAGSGAACQKYPTIQEAVNAAVPESVISVPLGVRNEAGILIENKDLTIRGANPQGTIIQAGNTQCDVKDRVFRISGARVSIEDLTIQNGCVVYPAQPSGGGAIWNAGSLKLNRVVLRANTVKNMPLIDTDAYTWTPMGGAVYSVGSLRMTNSTLLSNKVVSVAGRAMGGGVYNNGDADLVDNTLSDNEAAGYGDKPDHFYGGGIYNAGSLTMEYNTVVRNHASTMGGGLYNAGTIEVINNLFYGNEPPSASGQDCTPTSNPNCYDEVNGQVEIGSLITETIVPVYIPARGSVSIDAGICALSKTKVDQLGRARSLGSECDLGSTETGITYIPLAMAAPPMPDLVVTSVTVEPKGQLSASTQATVKVTIQNIGNKAAQGGFYVDLFINPRDTPPNHGGVSWLDLCKTEGCRYDEGIIWLAPATVLPNESFTFSSNIDIDPYAVRTSSSWDKYFAEGTVKLWAIVDSYEVNHNADGYIGERHEDNNRYEVPVFTVAKANVPVAARAEAAVMLPQTLTPQR